MIVNQLCGVVHGMATVHVHKILEYMYTRRGARVTLVLLMSGTFFPGCNTEKSANSQVCTYMVIIQ